MSLAPAPVQVAAPAGTAFPLAFAGWGKAVPDRSVTNDELSRTLDTDDAWITERTGIRARHVAGPGDTTATMAATAGRQALASAGMAPTDVDLVVVATTTPDRACPSTAADVAALLGIDAASCDVNAACTGFVAALHLTAPAVASGATTCALVIGSERMTSLIDPTDRTTAVLFGDGAGALVLTALEDAPLRQLRPTPAGARTAEDPSAEDRTTPGSGPPPGPRPGVVHSSLGGDAALLPHLEITPGQPWLQMDGPEVFRAATRSLVSSARDVLDRAGLEPTDIDWYVPHQANLRIVSAAVHRLGLDPTRVVVTLDRHGNTSSASIPLALATAVDDGRITPGDLVLTSAMGAGMTWGSTLLRWGGSA